MFGQIREAYKVTKKEKPWIGAAMAFTFVAIVSIGVLIGSLNNRPIYAAFITLPLALLGAMFLFSFVANRAAYSSIEGVMGAGASVMMAIRRGYTTTPMVAVNKQQDMVHRAVGRAGIVLVGEGSNGVRTMLAEETKKVERFVPGVPVTTLIVGDGEGRVAINKLQRTMKKLPKELSNNQVREVRNRLKAVGGFNMPIPKGPMPKNLRVPKV
ncbi:MAG: hypothetical protein RLZ80_234 [Actinomycetota bacterium]|jgi:hypothetical protein